MTGAVVRAVDVATGTAKHNTILDFVITILIFAVLWTALAAFLHRND